MKYIFDLDDTLISSTKLNNDAYNYALEKFGYPRLDINDRLTRDKLKFIPAFKLEKIIKEKQMYFTSEWLSYRVILNLELIGKIKEYGKENCYLWTKASKDRVEPILEYCNLRGPFSKVIYDSKVTLSSSIKILRAITNSNIFIIYENNSEFFVGANVLKFDSIRTYNFDVLGYLVS